MPGFNFNRRALDALEHDMPLIFEYIAQAWEESRLLRWTVVALLVGVLFAVAGYASALQPGWYAPDDNGEGLIVRCNDSGGCAMVWLTHGKDAEQMWLISNETCPRESAVCQLQMSETTGLWRGLGGETEIADSTVEIEVRQTDDGVTIEWDARALFPDQCFDIGSGGLLLRGCVGRKQFDLLAR